MIDIKNITHYIFSHTYLIIFLILLVPSSTAIALSNNISSDFNIHYNNTSVTLDVSETGLENSTRTISSFGERKIGSQNAAEASLFIKEEMEKAGLQVSLDNFSARVRTRDFNYWNVSGTNVVGIKEGNDLKDEIILVTAHYDSRIIVRPESGLRDIFDSEIRKPYLWPVWSDTYVCESANGTGADDNAGGVACMLELARVLQNESFDRTIYFIAFSGEEYNLLGSQAWVEAHSELENDIVAVINVDSIGNEPLYIEYLPQNAWLKSVLENETRDLGIEIQCEIPDYSSFIHPLIGGDHEIFWESDIPAVAICHHNDRNFHKLSDTIDNVDFSVVRNASVLTAKSLIYLASPDENQGPFVNISNSHVSGDSLKLIYKVSDPEATINIFFDNQNLGNLQSGRNFSLPEGEHTIKVFATDCYGNRGSDSINIVNEKNQNRSFEPPSQDKKYCGNYIIGYPKNFVDSNRTLYFYLDNFGPLYPGNLLILTPGSHNLKIWSENENGTVFMENEISDFRKYSMEMIEINNPIADRKNPLLFLSCLFAILAIVAFYGKRIKRKLLNLKGSKDKYK
ncbi:putative aminopeptidase [Methanosarcina barkeri str. Wiesmoor]|uniref:Peptidase M28 domain-containing protein n=2 Tax=Methanosarcina barkeri TaxID=2208 RepID=Q46EQ3_METBF|nr:M28 family metallopeptidase [Methanosarcina barkeri]AKB49595.1 putative aminopeptidase [Methanosarcina barkeri str. Wiesmoor]